MIEECVCLWQWPRTGVIIVPGARLSPERTCEMRGCDIKQPSIPGKHWGFKRSERAAVILLIRSAVCVYDNQEIILILKTLDSIPKMDFVAKLPCSLNVLRMQGLFGCWTEDWGPRLETGGLPRCLEESDRSHATITEMASTHTGSCIKWRYPVTSLSHHCHRVTIIDTSFHESNKNSSFLCLLRKIHYLYLHIFGRTDHFCQENTLVVTNKNFCFHSISELSWLITALEGRCWHFLK